MVLRHGANRAWLHNYAILIIGYVEKGTGSGSWTTNNLAIHDWNSTEHHNAKTTREYTVVKSQFLVEN